MRVAMAYIGMIMIWSTTPLALKWSTETTGFLFAVTSRMGIGTAIAVLSCFMMGRELPHDRLALKTYAASGSGAYLAMMFTYWGAQYIPSGWISVIFGLAPIITSILAAHYLAERNVGITKIVALVISLMGLWVMFQHSLEMGPDVVYGIAAVVGGVFFYSLSIVAVKQINAIIPPTAAMTGSLVVATSLFLVTWLIGDYQAPPTIPIRSAGAILYLSIVGSVLGFMLFYYVLQNVEATRTSLITLLTPGNALILGNLLNGEPITTDVILGAALVMGGLLLFQYGAEIRLIRIKRFNLFRRNRLGTLYKTK